jgi:hypothetical protein
MTSIVPTVEISQHGNLLGVGSPNGEIGSIDIIDTVRMGAELIIEPKVASFVEQINIVIAKNRKIGYCGFSKSHRLSPLNELVTSYDVSPGRRSLELASSRVARMQNIENAYDWNVNEIGAVIELVGQFVGGFFEQVDIQQESQLVARCRQEARLRRGVQIAA